MSPQSVSKRVSGALWKGRYVWLIGIISLFVLNFVVLYNVQRAVQETELAEERVKVKTQQLDLMWKEVNKANEEQKKLKSELEAKEAQLKQRESKLNNGDRKGDTPTPKDEGGQVVEKPHGVGEDERPLDDTPLFLNWDLPSLQSDLPKDIRNYLRSLTTPEQVMRTASTWLWQEIHRVQNPSNCSAAKFHFCPTISSCGAGCVLHQLAYCMVVGFANNRVTVFGDGFKYLRDFEGGPAWTSFFLPPTHCPIPKDIRKHSVPWTKIAEEKGALITRVDQFSRSQKARNFHPWAASDGFHTNTPFYLPPELEEVEKHHGDYRVWLVGHLESYMLRLKEDIRLEILSMNKAITAQWSHPVGGIHVRRTDHGVEAPFRNLVEYVTKMEEWYEGLGTSEKLTIYLATDEPKVVEEALRDFPQYKWLFFQNEGKKSGEMPLAQRSSKDGTLSLFSDWHFLRQVDYLVGTSSSQVTRMSYELMQPRHVSADKLFVSLDDPWYFP